MTPELARFVADIQAAVALFDQDLRYVAASKEWLATFGLCAVPLAGQRHDQLCNHAREVLDDLVRRALAGEYCDKQEIDGLILAAGPHRDAGRIVGAVIVLGQAMVPAGTATVCLFDALSELATRDEFARMLRRVMAEPDDGRRARALFAIHLDNLRNVANLHGTVVAEQVRKVIAGRLLAGLRTRFTGEDQPAASSDVLARLDTDQFGLACGAPVPSRGEAETLAARLLRVVQTPIDAAGKTVRLNASVGFLTIRGEHRDEQDALRDLDLALQQAQSLGPSRIIAWDPSLTAIATRRYTLAEELRRAVDNGEFVLHYQPIVQLSDERMIAAEALLRWNHPSDGLVAPAAFLPMLEETGLIVELGCWVIRETVRQLESWRMLYGRDIVDWVSVNLASRQFRDPTLLIATLRHIRRSGFSVNRLKFDIAETALVRQPEISRTLLGAFEELGVRVAIDDFGGGHSSPATLRRYPIDLVKIDAEFVAQIGTVAGDRLVRALLDVARMYGAAITAEGIETPEQRRFLQAAGCDFGAGYHFAQPMNGAMIGAYALVHAGEARQRPPAA